MKKVLILVLNLVFLVTISINAQKRTIAINPIDLNYRFQPTEQEEFRREAADPVCEYFKGKYYLFASKSGGYWSSSDLANWTYIPCKSISTIENYAPTILVIGDEMYFMGSWRPSKIYKTSNPDVDNWELIESKFDYQIAGSQDPAFFQDDNGQVYVYWGCSDKDPILGVEVDVNNGFEVLGETKVLIEHNYEKYGWEEKGENNEMNRSGYNEGPCVIKFKGKYYLQYAANGTQYRTYGDGTYISDHPLGPFTYCETSPFSFKPGGFIGGAGHGHTFKDKYGNYWHVATMKISKRHSFERRLALFPSYMSKHNTFHSHTVLTDYPFDVPQKKVNFEKKDFSMKWNLLSYGKNIEASSSQSGFEAENANDEVVETWWAAKTGKIGEWLQIDLGKPMIIKGLQINFADHDFKNTDKNSYVFYQYFIECSTDGMNWERAINKESNLEDRPHELIVLDKTLKARFIRITNSKNLEGQFSIYDFRIFGDGLGTRPERVSSFKAERSSNRKRFQFTWEKVDGATGYIINWGVKKDLIKNSTMVLNINQLEAGYFNRDSEYFFTIDSFNENGVTRGKTLYHNK